MQTSSNLVRCYAEGRNGFWEAVCLDFDLAVQGQSFLEVYVKLREQITLYHDAIGSGAPAVNMVRRRAPLWNWLLYGIQAIAAEINFNGNITERHSFTHLLAPIAMEGDLPAFLAGEETLAMDAAA